MGQCEPGWWGLREIGGASQQGDAFGGEPFFAPDGAKPFSGLGFDADAIFGQIQQFRNASSHGKLVGAELRALSEDDAVEIDHLKASFLDAVERGQQHAGGITAGVGRIGVGKQLANVAQRGGSQKRICDGVQEHIRIAVSERFLLEGHVDAPDAKWASRPQAMSVVANANSVLRHDRQFLPVTDEPLDFR